MSLPSPTREISFEPEPAPKIHPVFQGTTGTWQYVVACTSSRHAVIIDPLLDRSLSSGKIATIAADEVLAIVRQNRYTVDRILETHHSTQHASSAWYIRTQLMEETGVAPRVSMEKSMAGVQRLFRRKYGIQDANTWAYDFDGSYADGETLRVGRMRVKVIRLDVDDSHQFAFLIGKNIFAGSVEFAQDLVNKPLELHDNPGNYNVYTTSVDQSLESRPARSRGS